MIITRELADYFTPAAIGLIKHFEWDCYELIYNPAAIRMSDWEGNSYQIPWRGKKIAAHQLPSDMYACSNLKLPPELFNLVEDNGYNFYIECLYGYDYSWCGPGLVLRGTETILLQVLSILEAKGLKVQYRPLDKAWWITCPLA